MQPSEDLRERLSLLTFAYQPVKEQDAYLRLLSPKWGLLSFFEKGVRKPTHRLHRLCLPYQLVEAELLWWNQRPKLQEVSGKAHFPNLNQSLEALSAAEQFGDLSLSFLRTEQMEVHRRGEGDNPEAPLGLSPEQERRARELYTLWLHFLYQLDQRSLEADWLLCLAEFRLMALFGFALDQRSFRKEGERLLFQGSLFQEELRREGRRWHRPEARAYDLSAVALRCLLFVQDCPLDQLFGIRAAEALRQEVRAFRDFFLASSLDRRPTSSQLLQEADHWARLLQEKRGRR